MLCEKDDQGHVVLTPPRHGREVGNDLRSNVRAYCKRIGITEPTEIERVYGKWKRKAEESEQAARSRDTGSDAG